MDVIIRRSGEGQEKKELNGKLIELLLKTEKLEGIRFEVEPGATFGDAFSHDGEEIHLMLEGEMEVEINGKKFIAKKGDCFWFKSTQPHTGRNIGDKKAIFYSVAVPPTFW